MTATVNESVESFLSGKLSQVDVRKIEAELSRLWSQASGATSNETEDHPQVLRACSNNLILYSDRDDAESTDANMLDEILAANPARAILAIARPAANPRLDAWVTARCHLASSSGTKQICSELITVLAEGNLEQELVSVIESLLLGDLPTYLWWTADQLTGDKLGPFLASIDRLLVDSARAPYSFEFLRDLQQIVDSTDTCISVSDLNWRRLLGIRAAISEEFERKPFFIESLKDIKEVRISSCGQELQDDDCSIQALLFVGWLASRLSWDPVSFGKDKEKGSLASYEKSDGRKVQVIFKSTELNHVAAGSIYEIEIELEDHRVLRVSRDPAGVAGSLVLVVKENGERLRELIADDSDTDRVNLMGHELESYGFDKVFGESLESAVNLLHLLEAK